MAFAWTYYDESGPAFPALMLVFMAALIGFFLTGDLFNLFVFFELMGVAAYALTAYRSEDESAVMGALAFADRQQRRCVSHLARYRAGVRAHRRAQHGADRARARRARRRTGPRRVRVHRVRLARQGGARTVPLLACGRACGRAYAAVRPVLGHHGAGRDLRGGARVLERVLRRARRSRGGAAHRVPRVRRDDGADRRRHVLRPMPFQAAARVLDDRTHGHSRVRVRAVPPATRWPGCGSTSSDTASRRAACSCAAASC